MAKGSCELLALGSATFPTDVPEVSSEKADVSTEGPDVIGAEAGIVSVGSG